MPAISYATDKSVWKAANLNALYAEMDRKTSAVLSGKSQFIARRWKLDVPHGQIFAFAPNSALVRRRMAAQIKAFPGYASFPVQFTQAGTDTALTRVYYGGTASGYVFFDDPTRKIRYVDRWVTAGGFNPTTHPADLNALILSLIPYTADVDGEEYSIGLGTSEPVPSGYVSCVTPYTSAGFQFHYRKHPLAVAELCFDGVTSLTVEATWTRYNLFRVHNLQHVPITVTFEGPDGDLVLELSPWECRAVRRLEDGTLLDRWPGSEQKMRYFFPYITGDTPFWQCGDGSPGAGLIGPEATVGASNLGNVSLLMRWFRALGQEMDPAVVCDQSTLYGQFFGHPSDGKMGDLMHQWGRIQRVRISGINWTQQAETFVANYDDVPDALVRIGAIDDGSGGLKMQWDGTAHDCLDAPGATAWGVVPIASGVTVWPATPPAVTPCNAAGEFLGGWMLYEFTDNTADTPGNRNWYKTTSVVELPITQGSTAAATKTALEAIATVSGWVLTPFGWSLQVTQTTPLQTGFDLAPLGSIYDTVGTDTLTWSRRLYFTTGIDGSGYTVWPNLNSPAVHPPGPWWYLAVTGSEYASGEWAEWTGGKVHGTNGTVDARVTPQDVLKPGDRDRLICPPLGTGDGRKNLFGDPLNASYRSNSAGTPFWQWGGFGGGTYLRIQKSAWQWNILAWVVNSWTKGILACDWWDFPINWREGGSGDWVGWQPLSLGIAYEFSFFTAGAWTHDPVVRRVPTDGVFRTNLSITDSLPITNSTWTFSEVDYDGTLFTRNLGYIKQSDFLTFMAGQGLHGFGIRYDSGTVHPGGQTYIISETETGTTEPGTPSRDTAITPHDGTGGWQVWLDEYGEDRPATLVTSAATPMDAFPSNIGGFGVLKAPFPDGEDGFIFLQSLPDGGVSNVKIITDRWVIEDAEYVESGMTAANGIADNAFHNLGNSRDSAYRPRNIQTVVDLSYIDLA